MYPSGYANQRSIWPWEPDYSLHNEYWHATDTVNGNNEISQARYEEFVKLFGGGKKPMLVVVKLWT
jgi:hypothetical protein